jgi:putative copper export protein
MATVCRLVTTTAVTLGVSLTELPFRASDAAELPQIRTLAPTVAATTLLAFILSGRSTVRSRLAKFITAAAIVGPLLAGHSTAEHTTARSAIATASLAVHLLAASAWIGGLGALLRYARSGDPVIAVTRYSRLALVAAVSTGISGLLTAAIHLAPDGFAITSYGALALAKLIAFVALVGIGGWHRRRTLPALQAELPAAFWRLAIAELVLMAATIGLAVALSRTP